MAIREIQVAGYRSVRDIRLRLRPLNVLTGPNASGKSNLYNSVFLLAKAPAGGLAQAIADEGGMPSVLWAGARRTRSSNPSRRDPIRLKLGVKTARLAELVEQHSSLPAIRLELVNGETKISGQRLIDDDE